MISWFKRITRRVDAVRQRESLDRDLDLEMRQHVEMEAEDLARLHGMSPSEARRQALVAFGGVARFKEEHHDARGLRWFVDLTQDVR